MHEQETLQHQEINKKYTTIKSNYITKNLRQIYRLLNI